MKRYIHLLLILFLAASVSAYGQSARSFEISLTPDGEAMLYAYLPDAGTATGRAVVCCPGGGYEMLAIEYEGHWWKDFFNERGVAFFVLKYRMPHGDRSIPMSDAAAALRTVRDNASAWHINPHDVGIMGFSAGGHLAAITATTSDISVRPDFQILFYPVITLDSWGTHSGSAHNFLGAQVSDQAVVNAFSADRQVKRHTTPPAIIFMAADDIVVPVAFNGVAYASAMLRAENEVTMHMYPSGGHGWNLGRGFPYKDDILNSLSDWLGHIKAPAADAVRVACVGDSITDGHKVFSNYVFGYPSRLEQILGSGYMVRNFGVGARTLMNSADIPYQKEYAWQECKDFQPDIVVIKLGTNDSKPHNAEHLDDLEKDLQGMIDQLQALDSKPEIYLCLPVPAWDNPYGIQGDLISGRIADGIKAVAKNNGLTVIDLHTALDDKSLFQEDGVHPDYRGDEKMAQIVADAIR